MSDELIQKYSNLIYAISHYFEGYKDKQDLYQAGCVGLLIAYQNYDESYGTKFSTYAYSYILGEMKKLVREDKGIKISRKISKDHSKVEEARVRMAQVLMRDPTIHEIALYLNQSDEEIEEALQVVSLCSLDQPICTDGKAVSLSDITPDHQMDIHTWIAFRDELVALTSEERDILEKRYIENMTQTELANLYGVNQVQISRKEKQVREKIKEKIL